MSRRLTLGRVAGVYGVKGWVKIRSDTRPIENLFDYNPFWLAKGTGFEAKWVESKSHGDGLIARITGPDGQVIEDRDVAAGLIGAEIQIERSQLPPAEDGQYYWFDLVGLEVQNLEGVKLGKVETLVSNGAQDVLVVRGDEAERPERLIPFVHGHIIRSVSLEQGLIVADWQQDW